ncbi:hypothetical protein Droror1_Dr00008714 [Drosera rotundifolia]
MVEGKNSPTGIGAGTGTGLRFRDWGRGYHSPDWGIYVVCASIESQIYSQCNIYEARQKKGAFLYCTKKAANKEEEVTGNITSDGDLFLNGNETGSAPSGCENNVFHPSEFYSSWTVEPPSESLKHVLKHCTGWQQIPYLQDTPVASF